MVSDNTKRKVLFRKITPAQEDEIYKIIGYEATPSRRKDTKPEPKQVVETQSKLEESMSILNDRLDLIQNQLQQKPSRKTELDYIR